MPVPGVAPVRARSVVVTAAASRIPAPPREAGVTTRILIPPRLPDATETRTPAAAPVPAAMVMAEAATTAPIRPQATAGSLHVGCFWVGRFYAASVVVSLGARIHAAL